MIDSAQLRAARAYAGLTLDQLTAESGLAGDRIEALEADVSVADAGELDSLRRALETHGVTFVADGDEGPGGPGIRGTARSAAKEGIRPENLNSANDD